jgi:hypothetical protein
MKKFVSSIKKARSWFICDKMTLALHWSFCVFNGFFGALSLLLLCAGSINWFWIPLIFASVCFYPPLKVNFFLQALSVVFVVLLT